MKFSPHTLEKLPELPGVYLFKKQNGIILYIGKAKNIKKRVRSYFYEKGEDERKIIDLVKQIKTIEIICTQSEFEALLMEARLIKENQPKYNVLWKDDKHYIYIKITHEEFPRLLFSRREEEKNASYFGPMPSTRIVKKILYYLRSIFPYCTQKPQAKRACFYHHLRLCQPCPAEIKRKKGKEYQDLKRKYRRNIEALKSLLQGHVFRIKQQLKKNMDFFAAGENYEQAAESRDKLEKLDFLLKHFTVPETLSIDELVSGQRQKIEQNNLTNILRTYFTQLKLLKRIECYDVSHLQGKSAVGALVTFVNGLPEKNYYRRFKIKTDSTSNDFAMLSEIVARRLAHLDWPLPDLFVVDGGKPQLIALQKIFTRQKVNLPLIGLAKEEEKLVIPFQGKFQKLALPRHSPALQLIQRLRDESHRFAHNYHQVLRLKSLLSFSKGKKSL